MFGTPAARRPYLLAIGCKCRSIQLRHLNYLQLVELVATHPFPIGRDGAPSPSDSRAGGAFVSQKTALTRLMFGTPAARRPYLLNDWLQVW